MFKSGKQKRLERLERELQRIDRGMVSHKEVPGHPEICDEAVVVVRGWECGLGSAESAQNLYVDIPLKFRNGIEGGRKVLHQLRRAVKWMEYDLMAAEVQQLRAELAAEAAAEQPKSKLQRIAAEITAARELGEMVDTVNEMLARDAAAVSDE